MDLLLNLGLAWISVILTVLLAVIFILRKLLRRSERLKPALASLNRFLRRHHKILGLILIVTGLVHGLFSSDTVWSLNWGTVSWIFSILLGLNWLFKKQVSSRKGWMFDHRLLTIAFVAILAIHIVDVGIQAPRILMESISPTDPASLNISGDLLNQAHKQFEGVTLKDGTYQGDATGYRPGLVVEVVVKSGSISSIKVVSHNEVNSRFYSRPIQQIPVAIIESQSLDVDTVAGATRTSVGIINAVNNALSNAVVTGTLAPTETMPQGGGKGSGSGQGGGRGVGGRH